MLALNVLDPTSLLAAAGSLAVLVVLFCETGLLLGFFLPGDSLLFTAGVLCATGSGTAHLSLPVTLLCAAVGAVAGAQVGYVIGARGGRALLTRGRSRRLQQGAARAERFLRRYGIGRALVLARFVPLIRTVINPLAGMTGIPVRTFALWQTVGGLLWTAGILLAGFGLGSSIPNVDRYLLPVVSVVVAVSLVPVALEVRRSRRADPLA